MMHVGIGSILLRDCYLLKINDLRNWHFLPCSLPFLLTKGQRNTTELEITESDIIRCEAGVCFSEITKLSMRSSDSEN